MQMLHMYSTLHMCCKYYTNTVYYISIACIAHVLHIIAHVCMFICQFLCKMSNFDKISCLLTIEMDLLFLMHISCCCFAYLHCMFAHHVCRMTQKQQRGLPLLQQPWSQQSPWSKKLRRHRKLLKRPALTSTTSPGMNRSSISGATLQSLIAVMGLLKPSLAADIANDSTAPGDLNSHVHSKTKKIARQTQKMETSLSDCFHRISTNQHQLARLGWWHCTVTTYLSQQTDLLCFCRNGCGRFGKSLSLAY